MRRLLVAHLYGLAATCMHVLGMVFLAPRLSPEIKRIVVQSLPQLHLVKLAASLGLETALFIVLLAWCCLIVAVVHYFAQLRPLARGTSPCTNVRLYHYASCSLLFVFLGLSSLMPCTRLIPVAPFPLLEFCAIYIALWCSTRAVLYLAVPYLAISVAGELGLGEVYIPSSLLRWGG